ncbi:hypothetical protein Tco_0892064 [Tanacetum coccineum]|uniref:Uncharacterized protein n=1 Tax=Tanacetum coccineum TaxID=301880 RepID=A0ABQ5C7M7_9ASTR
MTSSNPSSSCRPTKVEVLSELPKVSMVNTSLKKLKRHLAGFDVVVKERTTATAITEGSWGAVEQHCLKSKMFEIKMNQVLNKNERLLEQVIDKDIVNIFVNSSMVNASVNVNECGKCLKLETELLNKKDFIKKMTYDNLLRKYTTLEKHCISLEVDTQVNQKIFQRGNPVSNESAPTFDQFFELNELKAQPQEKDMVIKKLKERIKSLCGNMNEDKVKKEIEEIETINIELELRVKPSTSASGSQPSDNTNKDKIQQTPIGNAFPLTRITTPAEVPLRKQNALKNDTPKPVVTLVYSRKSKKNITNVPASKPKMVKSVSANKKESNTSWGSTLSNVPSSSIDE